MTKYITTGKTIDGNFQGKTFTSCSKHDLPTDERITITIDGTEYERTIFERIEYRNMGENTLIARFVIVNGVQYEVAEAPETEPTWVHLADDQVCFRADRTEADDWSGNALPLFTRYEAERIAEHMNDANWCDERHEFDAEVDEYRVWDGDELLEVFAGTDVDGLHVYPIGTGIWTWEIDA